MNEFALIERLRLRAGGVRRDDSVLLGIGDDAALLTVTPGTALVVCTDTLVAGRHFPEDFSPADIGYRALAVNLSDLAAMGARPRWYQLALTLPEADANFIDDCAEGLATLADAHNLVLTGGDMTAGPLSLTVTLMGEVSSANALTRAGAKVGDRILVSGTLGGPGQALAARLAGCAPDPECEARFRRPVPRVALGMALAAAHPRPVSAAIDVSDGLAQDLTHICRASGVSMRIDAARLPVPGAGKRASDEGRAHKNAPDEACLAALSGGDDYELALTVPAARLAQVLAVAASVGCPLTEIGEVVPVAELPKVSVFDANGAAAMLPTTGFQHFA